MHRKSGHVLDYDVSQYLLGPTTTTNNNNFICCLISKTRLTTVTDYTQLT